MKNFYAHSPVYVLSCFSCVQLFVIPWTIACQVPLSMGFCRQEHWSGLSCPPPRVFPTQGSKLCLVHWQANSLLPPEKPIPIHIQVQKGSSNLPVSSQLPAICQPLCSRLESTCHGHMQIGGLETLSEDREASVGLQAERSKFKFRLYHT